MENCKLCGKPAKYISMKYESPLCEECAKKQVKNLAFELGMNPDQVDVEDFYTEPCFEMNNINKKFTV